MLDRKRMRELIEGFVQSTILCEEAEELFGFPLSNLVQDSGFAQCTTSHTHIRGYTGGLPAAGTTSSGTGTVVQFLEANKHILKPELVEEFEVYLAARDVKYFL